MNLTKLIRNNFKDMKIIEKENLFLIKARYGPSDYIKIYKKLSNELVCFVGFVLGDGNLGKVLKRVTIELTDKDLINKIRNLLFYLFNKKININMRIDKRKNRQLRFYININSKAIYLLLNKIFKIPIGKKSNI